MLEIYTAATKSDLRSSLAARWGSDSRDVVGYRSRIVADLDRMGEVLSNVSEPLIEQCLPTTELSLNGIPAWVLKQVRLDLEPASDALLSQQVAWHKASTAAAQPRSHRDHPNVTLRFSTIHGVKRETYDAVILYTGDLKHRCGCEGSNSNRWDEILHHPLGSCESKRVAYVGVSRAAQAVAIVSTKRDADTWRALTVSSAPTLFD